MNIKNKKLNFFPPSFKKYKYKNYYKYKKYIKKKSQINQNILQTKNKYKNNLFHQTLILKKTTLISNNYKSNSSLTNISKFNYSLKTINPTQH